MKVILLQDVPNVGKKYDVKNVSDGYARNFLFPRNLAKIATTKAIQTVEHEKKRWQQHKEVQQNILDKNISDLEGLKISIAKKANEKGHLFAAISPKEISNALKKEKHLEIPAELIELEKPIKEKGEHKIKVKDKEFIVAV